MLSELDVDGAARAPAILLQCL